MHIRTSIGVWGATFLTSLGLSPLSACGGITLDGPRALDSHKARCTNPTPLVVGGEETGFVQCGGGALARVEKKACPNTAPREAVCQPSSGGPGFQIDCWTDADCTGGAYGHCEPGTQIGGCYCSYGCVRDEDCGAAEICLCGEPVGQCVTAACSSDTDCDSGEKCLSYVRDTASGATAFRCSTQENACGGEMGWCPEGWTCAFEDGQTVCRGQLGVDPGRPFLVCGAPRLASPTRRTDWSSGLTPDTAELDAITRATLGARWTEIALMEHASVAAFARFALELLSLGAPPRLVTATYEAMADETLHARDAFALASAYLERPTGPGALDPAGSLGSGSPLEIVRTAILEGCIGETVAAVEAAEALAQAKDPAVREALARVTADEARHAELAFRFVEWVLEHGDATLRLAAGEALIEIAEQEAASADVARRARGGAIPRDADTLRAHGVLDPSTRSELRRVVLRDVVSPCARALVARSRAGREARARAAMERSAC